MNRSEPDPVASDDFERELQRQPLQPVPPAWRAEILTVAARRALAAPPRVETGARTRTVELLRAWLWPNPAAWAGVAATWFLIAVLNHAAERPGPATGLGLGAPSPYAIATMLEQRRRVESQLELPLTPPDTAPEPEPVIPAPRGALPSRLPRVAMA